MKFSHNIRK